MRNLKRFYAVVIAIAMLVSMIAPTMVFAATGSDYAADAKALYNMDLYKGLSETEMKLDLDATLNRETAATMVLRLFGLEEEALTMDPKEAQTILVKKFPKDGAKVSVWAARQVAYAVEAEIIKGFPDGTFQPQGLLTGTQYSVLLMKLLGYSDWTFETVAKKFGEVAKLNAADQTAFASNSAIKKSILTGMSRKALDCMPEGATITLAQQLVNDGVLDLAKATAAGVAVVDPEVKPSVGPTASVTAAPTTSSVPGVVYGTVNVTAAMEAAKSVASSTTVGQALVPFGTLKLATTATQVSVTGIKLQRTGLSADTDIDGITVWDGSKKLNVSAIFSNSYCNIIFTSPVDVMAGVEKVLVLKMNLEANVNSGSQITLSVTEVKGSATTSVVAQYPFASGVMTVANVNLGSLAVNRSTDEPSVSLSAGTTDIRLAKYDFAASTEAQTLNAVTFSQNGSAADSDVKNLKLFDGTTQLGVASELVNRKVTFTFTKEIAAGAIARLTLKGDMVGGAGRNVKFGIADVNDVQALGKTYGTVIVGSFTEDQNLDGTRESVTSINGKELSVSEGTFIISRSTSTPAAGTISTVVDNQKFVTFKIEAIGEPVQLRTIKVQANVTSDGNGRTPLATDLTDVKVISGDLTLAQEETPFATSNPKSITLSTPIDVTPGTPVEITISADIISSKSADAGDKYSIGVDQTSTLTGVGKVSGKDVTFSAAGDIPGNDMTIGTLAVTATRVGATDENVFTGESAKKLIEFDLKHNMTEDVDISSVVVEFADKDDDNGATSYVGQSFTNAKLVDSTGKLISEVQTNVLNTSREGNLSFPLTTPIKVAANTNVRFALIADVLSTANTADNYYFGLDSTSVARTTASGTDVAFTDLAATEGKLITVSTGGVTITAAYSTNVALEDDNVYAGDKDVEIGAYNFVGTNVEDAIINKVVLSPYGKSTELVTVTAVATTAGTATITVGGTAVALNLTLAADGETTSTVATKIADAINANATTSAIYYATATAATVLVSTKTASTVEDIVTAFANGTSAAAAVTVNAAPTYCAQQQEVITVTTAGTTTENATITVGGTVVTVPVVAGPESTAQVAARIANAINSNATTGASYIATPSTANVTIKSINPVTATTNIVSAYVATTMVATITNTPTLNIDDLLDLKYVTNVRLVDEKGTVLASNSSIQKSSDFTLTDNSFVVPNVNATTNVMDRTRTMRVLADISADADYGKKFYIRLGDANTGTNDIEYKGKQTGASNQIANADVLSEGTTDDAVFSVGAAKLTITNKALGDSSPALGATAAEVGRFIVKNNGTRYIELTQIKLSDLKSFVATAKWNTVTIKDVDSGDTLGTGTTTVDGIINITDTIINPGDSLELSIEANLTTCGSAPAAAGSSIQMKVNAGTIASGTTYQVLGTTTQMTIDGSLALSAIVAE